MHTNIDALFDALWQDYLLMTPSARKIHDLLGQKSEIINDHIALRTFDLDKVNLEVLAAHLIALGYVEAGDYHFEQKKLRAKHFEHGDPTQPKVFISELMVASFSQDLQKQVQCLVEQLDESATRADDFLYSGRHWQLDSQTYQSLLAESEYAAWVAAFGYRANHFTVSVNDLANFQTLESVNQALKQANFVLNSAGGEIKGSASVLLEQSSTMADTMDVEFLDQSVTIPSCFYEFARRYPKANGQLYTGFVAASADKIFESTNVTKR